MIGVMHCDKHIMLFAVLAVMLSCVIKDAIGGFDNITLVGGRSVMEGRVEVLYQGVWGTVCDDLFDDNAAKVVCASLGHPSSHAVARGNAHYGQGTGRITLDDVVCRGNEASLNDCRHSPFITHNCAHSEDVGVECDVLFDDIRLVGGGSSMEGRVEVLYQGVWGTVCDDQFNDNAAKVVCASLGYPRSAAVAKPHAYFQEGIGPITLDDVTCNGNEASLKYCRHRAILTHNCGHHEDVGVVCGAQSCRFDDIRLVDGGNRSEGRVEVLYQGVWGTICDDFFNNSAAKVVCSSLGYPYSAAVARYNVAQGTGRITLDDVACQGNEPSLNECQHRPFLTHNCVHGEDVGVACDGHISALRLVNGTTAYEGRIEIRVHGIWGTVCDDIFNAKAAAVVCGSLGHSRLSAIARSGAFFGRGSGPILIDNVNCRGTEPSLNDCAYVSVHNCGHHEDVGVVCQES